MHELAGKIVSVLFTAERKPLVTMEFEDRATALDAVDALKGLEKILVKLGKYSKKRSLDANAYCWVLIGEIAKKTNVPKNEVYMEYIRHYGEYEIVRAKEKAVPALRMAWEAKGLGWQTEVFDSVSSGYLNVLLYYGSSCYTTKQMTRFIEQIRQDCISLGIPTKPQEEIESLLKSWEGKF